MLENNVLNIAYVVFALFLVFFLVYGFFLVYHLFEFSYNAKGARLLAGTYIVVTLALLAAVFFFTML